MKTVPPFAGFHKSRGRRQKICFSDEGPHFHSRDSFEQDAMPKANHTLLPLQDSLEDVIPEPKVRKGKEGRGREDG